MSELARSTYAVNGIGPGRRLAASWNRDVDLGFVVPLVVAPGPGVTSNPIVFSGLNSGVVLADVAVGVAGTLQVEVRAVRPDLTLWPPIGQGAVASTAVAGFIIVPFGSRGRDQNSPFQGYSSLFVVLTVIKLGVGNVTLNAIKLCSMTRP
jgi:hypothetical protein